MSHLASLVVVVAGDEGGWALWQEDSTEQDHEGGHGGDGQGDPPAVLVQLHGAVVDELGDDDSDGGAPLEQQVEGTAVLAGGHLAGVDGDRLQPHRGKSGHGRVMYFKNILYFATEGDL